MSGRRNRTRSSVNPPAKAGQSSKQPQAPPAAIPTAPAPGKPAPAPVPQKATSPLAPKETPSARVRKEWKSFEGWLKARRAERDRQISDKLKEVMPAKKQNKNKWAKQAPATDTTDMGAFEDKLNEDLAEAARAEWLRRMEAAGLNEEDWTDITEEEMKAVEAAFIPQERGSRIAEEPQSPPSQPATQPAEAKPAVTTQAGTKAGPSPYAARVEEESTIPGAWSAPSPPPVPEQGIMGRNRPYTPMAQLAQQTMGRVATKEQVQADALPTESLWEAQMRKKMQAGSAQSTEGLGDQQAPGARAKSNEIDTGGNKLPSPEMLWEMHMRKATPKPASVPTSEPDSDSLWDRAFAQKAATPAPQLQPQQHEYESLWDLHTSQGNDMNQPDCTPPAASKTPAFPPSRTKNSPSSRAAAPPKPATSNKTMFGKSPLSSSWDMDIETESPSLKNSAVDFPTPASSIYAAAYGYISPVFLEMEDETFPRIPDPLPEVAVEEAIFSFHSAAAEAEIELRRQLVSGVLDDGALEQLVSGHMSAMEMHARKIVEEWKEARAAEEQRQRAEEEQKRRLAEARRQGLGRKGGLWRSAPIVEASVRAASPTIQAKKPQQPKNRQARLLEESFGARPATPAHLAQAKQVEDAGLSLWEMQMAKKAAADEGRPMPSFAGIAPQAQAPPPVQPSPPSPSPWAQLAKPPAHRNPFLQQQQPAPPVAPETSLSPWEAMLAKTKQQAPPQAQNAWEEDNTDDSDEGAPSWGQMFSSARGGAATMWGMASSALGGGERPRTPAQAPAPPRPSAPAPPVPAAPETPWASNGLFARSGSNGPTTPEDPRFATWRPPKIVDPDEHVDPAKKMQDLALQNLFQSADDADDTDLISAMSMYSKATQSAARKKTTPFAKR